MSSDDAETLIRTQLRVYRTTLQHDRRHLLERFHVVDFARKVVGVGSVGTRAFIVLLQGRDERDPLFLQVKERRPRCSRATCPRAAISNPANAWCTVNACCGTRGVLTDEEVAAQKARILAR